jgi:fibronectin type 3 domain-containing protein
VQAVYSSVGQKPFIDLTWTPNSESDLAGYVVYRRNGSGDFVQVSPPSLKAPAWRDNDVQPGGTYVYAVSAIDVRGNQSARSEPAQESAPQEPQ